MSKTGWTVETLKAHIDQRFVDQDRAVQAALQAAEKAVTKAEVAAEKRFDSVNEFRATLQDQASTFMPRAEAEIRVSSLQDKVDLNTEFVNRTGGENAGRLDSRAVLFGVLVILAGIAAAVSPHIH